MELLQPFARSREEGAMASHLHEAGGRRFQIDVSAIRVIPSGPPVLFAALIARLGEGSAVPVVRADNEQREVYGPTEDWAVRNACTLVDRGGWYEDGASVVVRRPPPVRMGRPRDRKSA
jgi:hypothetical protein